MLKIQNFMTCRRLFSTSGCRAAGLQGFQGQHLSPEVRERMVFRKTKILKRLERQSTETKEIAEFLLSTYYSNDPER